MLTQSLKRLSKRALLGRRGLQPFFSALNRLALRGMNIGGGSDVADSGERYVLERIAAATTGKPVVVFDIGANVGDYATMVHEVFRDRATIHSFEPAAETFAALERKCGSFARVHNFGFSDQPAQMTLYSDPAQSGLSSVYARNLDHLNLRLSASETISLRVLDDFCRENGITHIDLLKLDVEGHELAILHGAKGVIASNAIECIQFEFGGCNIDSRTYFRDFYTLLSPNFRLYRILTNGMWPIDRYSEILETFTTTNYLAVRRPVTID